MTDAVVFRAHYVAEIHQSPRTMKENDEFVASNSNSSHTLICAEVAVDATRPVQE
jgi:hypothetical protein